MRGIKQPLRIQFFLEHLESHGQIPLACNLDTAYKKRIGASFFVDVQIAVNDDRQAVPQLVMKPPRVLRRKEAVDLAVFVADGKIQMSATVIL